MRKGTRRLCKYGHVYYKSSDCPTCPVCETARKPDTGFLSIISAPARRALDRAGINTLAALATWSEAELLKLHGMGPNAIVKLRAELAKHRLSLRRS